MRHLLLGLVLSTLAAGAAEATAGRALAGPVERVIDGDTIVVEGRVLRLFGLHAPERRQRGGLDARAAMIEMTHGRIVACRLTGQRSHGRHVAVCRTGDGDLAARLIDAGLGRDCPRFSAGAYAGHETEAGRRLPLPAYCQPR